MTAASAELYSQDPQFYAALLHFQAGEWETGLAKLNQLIETYPLAPDLRALRQEMLLRAQVDRDEQEDLRNARRRAFQTLAVRLVVLVVLLGSAVWGYNQYSALLRQRSEVLLQTVNSELQVIELAVKFRNAQDLQQAGRLAEAQLLLDEIRQVQPDYPGLQQALEQAGQQATLDGQYAEATQLLVQGSQLQALELFQAIELQQPYYKDVSLQIASLKRQLLLDDQLAKAEGDFNARSWQAAAAGYETVRALEPNYAAEQVEERLVNSYLNAAEALLVEQPDSLDALEMVETYFYKALAIRPRSREIEARRAQARRTTSERLFTKYVELGQAALVADGDSLSALQTAEGFFQKALELRPDDPLITLQRELAQQYLKAQEDFARGQWTRVIEGLEQVISEDPDYAVGTARQTLYEAHLARGANNQVSGQYELALADFQQAAILAQATPDAELRIYEAQLKLAELQGILRNFEAAVPVYQSALKAAGLYALAEQPDYALAPRLTQAERYTEAKRYELAYNTFRQLAEAFTPLYATTNYEVKSGEYLTQLANRFQTTIGAILEANKLASPADVTSGKWLIIPTLPDAQP